MQAVLINQIILRQRLDQYTAPVDKDVLARLLLKLAYGFNDIVANEGRVPPGRCGFQVVDTTYLWMLFIASANGSPAIGSNAPPWICHVFRPSKSASAWDIA